MLKCDVLNKQDNSINFDDLSTGDTFVIDSDGYEWIGMKVKEGADHEDYDEYIVDMSDDIGRLYSDVDKYNIVRLIDLKVVEDEGDE